MTGAHFGFAPVGCCRHSEIVGFRYWGYVAYCIDHGWVSVEFTEGVLRSGFRWHTDMVMVRSEGE